METPVILPPIPMELVGTEGDIQIGQVVEQNQYFTNYDGYGSRTFNSLMYFVNLGQIKLYEFISLCMRMDLYIYRLHNCKGEENRKTAPSPCILDYSLKNAPGTNFVKIWDSRLEEKNKFVNTKSQKGMISHLLLLCHYIELQVAVEGHILIEQQIEGIKKQVTIGDSLTWFVRFCQIIRDIKPVFVPDSRMYGLLSHSITVRMREIAIQIKDVSNRYVAQIKAELHNIDILKYLVEFLLFNTANLAIYTADYIPLTNFTSEDKRRTVVLNIPGNIHIDINYGVPSLMAILKTQENYGKMLHNVAMYFARAISINRALDISSLPFSLQMLAMGMNSGIEQDYTKLEKMKRLESDLKKQYQESSDPNTNTGKYHLNISSFVSDKIRESERERTDIANEFISRGSSIKTFISCKYDLSWTDLPSNTGTLTLYSIVPSWSLENLAGQQQIKLDLFIDSKAEAGRKRGRAVTLAKLMDIHFALFGVDSFKPLFDDTWKTIRPQDVVQFFKTITELSGDRYTYI